MPLTRTFFFSIVVALAMEASAFARDPVAAEGLFRAGREALKREDWAGACAAFSKSQELDPAAGTALNLAVCEEKQGHVASAWQRLREALDLMPPGDDRAAAAKKKLGELEPRVPRLTVRLAPGAPEGTRVRRDSVDVDGALLGFPQPIDPGKHVVRVEAPGRVERSFEVTIGEAERREIDVAPGAPKIVAPPPPSAPAPSKDNTLGYVFGGIGLSAVALGAVTGIAVIQRGHERDRLCPNSTCPTAQALADARSVDSSGNLLSAVSTGAFVVGVVGLAAGAYFIWRPSKDTRVGVGFGSISIGGGF